MIFDQARWINNPKDTYIAENKAFQLHIAGTLGFRIPTTAIANYLPEPLSGHPVVAAKALDSFLVRQGEQDLFFYTTPLPTSSITYDTCHDMPVIFQRYIDPKVDIRITVVGDRCFAAATEMPITGDWRRQRSNVRFCRADAPDDILAKCRALLRHLHLNYGAIDLVRQDGHDYFLEINPTGEWAWLDDVFDGDITRALVDELSLNFRTAA